MTDAAAATSPPQRDPVGSFRNAWTIFRVRGVPVRLDASWLIIAAIVVWLFYGRLARTLAEEPLGVVIAAAAAAALLFFSSLLAHELGHALTSLDRQIPVLAITLFLMGGVTESTREARTARDEFVIVGIGPFISLVLAAGFGLVYDQVAEYQPYAAVAGYLAWTNLLLALFNVVPGYPLDGGRLLRAVLWAVTKQPHRATRWAARVGQAFALLVAGYGLVALLGPRLAFGGLWNILIGFFLFRGATDAHRRARLRERIAGRTVGALMGSVPPTLRPDMPLREAIEHIQQRPSLPWPVAGPGEPVRRVIWLDDIDAVAGDRWLTTAVSDVAHDAAAMTVRPDTSLDDALDVLARAPHQTLLVAEDGRPVGLLTPSLVDDVAP